jgi:hypothetical protein
LLARRGLLLASGSGGRLFGGFAGFLLELLNLILGFLDVCLGFVEFLVQLQDLCSSAL